MVAMEIVAKGAAGVAFVGHQTLWTETALTCLGADGPCLHEFFCLIDITCLTGCEQESNQSACTFTTKMDFGAETTTRTS